MITFKQVDDQKVNILKDGELVGHIFSPSGSSNSTINGVQICGFSEAFDYWGCGIFKGFKDIQLLFDGKKLGGEHSDFSLKGCLRCYREPCQCENRIDQIIEKVTVVSNANPFDLKREHQLSKRIEYKEGKVPVYTADLNLEDEKK